MDTQKESLKLHEKLKGKIEIKSKLELKTKQDLSLGYTPGVAEPCRRIAKNKEDVYKYTIKGNTVAVVSDGSSVLGLGNIGSEASLPVMEGKAILFKEFANIDAFPICLKKQDIKTTIETIRNIAPVFGGINLEDIAAPECFEIEEALQNLGIPVMHDDQHGTAVVVLAALINSLKLTDRNIEQSKIIINGAGAAGIAITKMLLSYGAKHIILCDSKGTIFQERKNLNKFKEEIAKKTNNDKLKGNLNKAIIGADVFIGVSVKNCVTKDMIKSMSKDPIIFAMANPDPEILPNEAKKAGAGIITTGRSDFPNQVNNVLAFPGIFRGALDAKAKKITEKMKLAAAETLAKCIKPSKDKILPNPLDKSVVPKIAEAVKKAYK
jgi:malate dehydrogenase (oxaloacetate-decarboxylating)